MTTTSRTIGAVLLLAAAALALVPIVFAVLASSRSEATLVQGSLLDLGGPLSLQAWRDMWRNCLDGVCTGLSSHMGHSLKVTLGSLAASLVLGGMTGAAMINANRRLSRLLHAVLVFALFLPPQVTLYPMVQLIRGLHLFSTMGGLIAVHAIWGLPLVALVIHNQLSAISPTIRRSLALDGIPFWPAVTRIYAPLAAPAVLAVAILQFAFIWNDFVLAATFGPTGMATMTQAAFSVATGGYGAISQSQTMAGMLIASAPAVTLYLLTAMISPARSSNFAVE